MDNNVYKLEDGRPFRALTSTARINTYRTTDQDPYKPRIRIVFGRPKRKGKLICIFRVVFAYVAWRLWWEHFVTHFLGLLLPPEHTSPSRWRILSSTFQKTRGTFPFVGLRKRGGPTKELRFTWINEGFLLESTCGANYKILRILSQMTRGPRSAVPSGYFGGQKQSR